MAPVPEASVLVAPVSEVLVPMAPVPEAPVHAKASETPALTVAPAPETPALTMSTAPAPTALAPTVAPKLALCHVLVVCRPSLYLRLCCFLCVFSHRAPLFCVFHYNERKGKDGSLCVHLFHERA